MRKSAIEVLNTQVEAQILASQRMKINNKFNTTNLGSIAKVQTGPFGSQLHEKDYVEQGTPIITVEHMGYGSIIEDNIPCVSESDTLRLKSFYLRRVILFLAELDQWIGAF